MSHRSTTVVAVAAALGSITIGCANPNQQQTVATTQPAPAVVAKPPAPPRPAPPPPAPPAPAPPVAKAKSPAPPAPPAPAPTTGRTYTVKPGDSLWKISKEVYGDATKYEQIQKANPTLDPQLLQPGTVIVIP